MLKGSLKAQELFRNIRTISREADRVRGKGDKTGQLLASSAHMFVKPQSIQKIVDAFNEAAEDMDSEAVALLESVMR